MVKSRDAELCATGLVLMASGTRYEGGSIYTPVGFIRRSMMISATHNTTLLASCDTDII